MAEILEKELEEYLYNLYNKDWSEENDYPIDIGGKFFRQVEIVGYGRIDLLAVDLSAGGYSNYPVLSLTIIELKKEEIDLTALGQISRYKIALERFLKKIPARVQFEETLIRGILIGKEYADGDICFTVDAIDWLECYLYRIDLSKGLVLEKSSEWYNEKEDFGNLEALSKQFFPDYVQLYKHERRETFNRRKK